VTLDDFIRALREKMAGEIICLKLDLNYFSRNKNLANAKLPLRQIEHLESDITPSVFFQQFPLWLFRAA
jgi:hypothetical protein